MFASSPAFLDRRDAGQRLAKALAPFAALKPVVLALPRGGVPVAVEVAKSLRAPLDLLMVRKIGAPNQSEYGLGAIVGGAHPQLLLNKEAVASVQPSQAYLRAEISRQLAEIERRRSVYLGEAEPILIKNRVVIVVDDGIATGGTARVAVRALRQGQAARVVVAVPVAPADTLEWLGREADDVVCLLSPRDFYAVGAHYGDFAQTGDEEVIALLREARQAAPDESRPG